MAALRQPISRLRLKQDISRVISGSLRGSILTSLALREYKQRQQLKRLDLLMEGDRATNSDLVFSKPDGTPLLPNSVTHAFIKIVRGAGLRGIRFHDLRHTHASLMLKQGVHPKIVSERLGHATIGITLDTYSHVTPGLQEAAALKFEQGLQTHDV
jgi:integrase